MKFPSISDIATESVVSLNIDDTLYHAIEIMMEHEHRNIVVVDSYKYFMLNVLDIIKEQEGNIDLDTKLKDLNLVEIPVIYKNKNVLDALSLIDDKSQHICVVNNDGSLYGFISQSDITTNIDPETLMDNYRLSDFLKVGKMMRIVPKDYTTRDVFKIMANDNCDHVLIIEDNKPIGILTTKDIMRLLKQQEDTSVAVSTYMSTPVQSVKSSASIKTALAFLKSRNYNRVVVVDELGNLSGVIGQKELISLTYSKWVMLMKEYQDELSEINNMLESKNKEYELLASTDSLTGLYNRHKFSELYVTSYKTMLQRRSKMSLIMLDIDYFKKINDKFGHNLGDASLIQVSHVILRTLRNVDIICRWGGEEFLALLPTVDLIQAKKISEKIRKNVEKLNIETVGHLTVSIGITEVREGDTMNDVISRVDKALYCAKNYGRNCVKTENDI